MKDCIQYNSQVSEPTSQLWTAAFRDSRLIFYLGLDDFRGIHAPEKFLSVCWHHSIELETGSKRFLCFADRKRDHHEPTGAAFALCKADKEEFELIYWRGTSIDFTRVSNVEVVGTTFPLKLVITHEKSGAVFLSNYRVTEEDFVLIDSVVQHQ